MLRLLFRGGQNGNHTEGPQGGDKIRCQIKNNGAPGHGPPGKKRHHHVSQMGDGRIGQEAFDIVLQQGQKVARKHGQDGHRRQSPVERISGTQVHGRKKRTTRISMLPFDTVATNPVTGAGAPW